MHFESEIAKKAQNIYLTKFFRWDYIHIYKKVLYEKIA